MIGGKGTETGRVDFTSFHNIIGSELCTSITKRRSVNPATNKPLWEVPIATENDVNAAVTAAQSAFTAWSETPFEQRQRCLQAFEEEIEKHRDDFMTLLAQEIGRPAPFGHLEIDDTVKFISYFANITPPAEKVIQDDERVRIITRCCPLGVVAGIVPWNFPLVLAAGKVAQALVTGNCIILKPSPFAPYSCLKLAEIGRSFFPPGVLQALSGDDLTGPLMTEHPGIHKVSFTGSTATGKKVLVAASRTLKRVTLELGGNDATIIFSDVDIEKVAARLALGCFLNSGQVCLASKRIYVHEEIYAQFLPAFVGNVQKLLVGQPLDKGVMIGPVQNKMQTGIVQAFFDDCKSNGYKFALGGDFKRDQAASCFFQPAILDRPPDNSKIVTEEPFGPIVPMLSWKTEEEVIRRANDTKSGLGATIWTRNVETAARVARRLDVGSVWINSNAMPVPQGTLHGHKESGFGGEWGIDGMLGYCSLQTIQLYKSVL
ncbi:aldehyde dehydrogenase domain-containing protein [Ilyonectria destructans]|nr:aldehyde dehydrogenase domain-containing protein [Ilyonectria destructans]